MLTKRIILDRENGGKEKWKEWLREDYKREKALMIGNKMENGRGHTVKKGKRFSYLQPGCHKPNYPCMAGKLGTGKSLIFLQRYTRIQ